MIFDNRSLFSDKQAITATAASTNVIDTLALGKMYDGTQLKRRLGVGMVAPLLIQVIESFDALTSLQVTLQSSDTENFAVAKNEISQTLLLADLTQGRQLKIDELPRDVTGRYLRLYYTVTGTAPTVGQITAGFVAAVDGGYKG